MRVRVLGTSAGGGLPQWNCACPNCRAAREGRLGPRLQCALAFCDADAGWYLVNATPDVTHQMSRWPELHPRRGVRQAPVRGVLLTDGELDHVLGLLHLRESTPWTLYATPSVLRLLREDLCLLPALERYNEVRARPLTASGMELPGVEVRIVETSRRRPRYARGGGEGSVVALVLTDRTTGQSLVYAPGVAELSEPLRTVCVTASVVLFDGTFFTDDEPVRMGIASENARAMGHVPVSGRDGSACWLADLPTPYKLYVHLNNTNPLLDPDSQARAWIRELGLEVAEDGWEVVV